MTDKRSESERVSARPPLPSIAPPTDDIDSEWGADDDIPAAARVPQLSASASATPAPASAPRASTPAPAPRLSTPLPAPRLPTPVPAAPRPVSSAPPVARSSTPAPSPTPALGTPAPVAGNPLRKQTLLGIAPVIPGGSAAPPATATAPASSPPAAPSSPPPSATTTPSSAPRADNPLRKQTLLGIAPVLPSTAKVDPEARAPAAEEPAEASAAAPLPSSPPAGIASNSPFTRDVTALSEPPAAPRIETSSTDHDMPALRPRRPRWLLPVAAAALLALGVVGLRRLDHAPATAPLPAAPAPAAIKPAPVLDQQPAAEAAPAPAAPPSARPADDDEGDDEKPQPTTPDAEPLATSAASAATGEVRRVLVASDPPGARLFWRGKEVGTTPFTLELKPGEKHSYELGLPGYVTRKVVIDGAKSEISIGMKPESGVFTGASPRK